MRFGIQFHPLPTAPETVVYAKRALSQYPFEKVWVPDHLTHEHALITLAAIIAQTQVPGDHPRARASVGYVSGALTPNKPVVRQSNTEVDHVDFEAQRCRHLL